MSALTNAELQIAIDHADKMRRKCCDKTLYEVYTNHLEALIAEQWRRAEQRDDAQMSEWIKNTGTMPVKSNVEVEIVHRDGMQNKGRAGGWYWSINGMPDDIAWWRRAHVARDAGDDEGRRSK